MPVISWHSSSDNYLTMAFFGCKYHLTSKSVHPPHSCETQWKPTRPVSVDNFSHPVLDLSLILNTKADATSCNGWNLAWATCHCDGNRGAVFTRDSGKCTGANKTNTRLNSIQLLHFKGLWGNVLYSLCIRKSNLYINEWVYERGQETSINRLQYCLNRISWNTLL